MNGAKGEAIRAARLHGQDDGVTYSHVIVVIARRPQRRFGHDVTVAGLGVGGFKPGGINIACPAALYGNDR